MPAPWSAKATLVTMILASLITAWRWRDLDAPMRWTGLWIGALVLENVGSILWARYVDRTNNLTLVNGFLFVEVPLALGALAAFQRVPLAARAVRFTIPLLLLFVVVAFSTFEDPRNFSIFSYPIFDLVALGAALTALVSHALDGAVPAWRTPRFYALTSLAIYFATGASLSILMAYYLSHRRMDYLAATMGIRIWITWLCLLVLTGTLLWTPRASSTSSR